MKALEVLFFFCFPPLAGWAGYREVAYRGLQRRLRGLSEPVLWLPKRERQEHARKLLQREDNEYTQRIIEQTTQYLKGSQ